MNDTPPGHSRLQEPDVIAAAAVENFEAQAAEAIESVREAITGWLQRTQEVGFRIPIISDLIARVIQPPTIG